MKKHDQNPEDTGTGIDRREFLVRSGIGLGALALGVPLLAGCVTGSSSISTVPLNATGNTVALEDVLADPNLTPVVFGESKKHGVAFVDSRYAAKLDLGSYVAVEQDRTRLKDIVDEVAAGSGKVKLEILRMRDEAGAWVPLGYALGGVGRMSLNRETATLKVNSYDPEMDSSGGGGGGGGGGAGGGG